MWAEVAAEVLVAAGAFGRAKAGGIPRAGEEPCGSTRDFSAATSLVEQRHSIN